MNRYFEVKKSLIHGRGVFAKVDISEGDEFVSDILIIKEAKEIKELIGHIFIMEGIIKCLCLDIFTFLNWGNGDITPSYIDKENMKMKFTMLKSVKKGQEVLV